MQTGKIARRIGLMLGVMCVLGLSTAARAAEETKAPPAAKDGAKPPIDATHPLYRPLELAYEARVALKDVKDYEAVFLKKETVSRRLKSTTMNIKQRVEPFSVYLFFVEPNKGREVIYVDGKHKNQIVVHDVGISALAGTLFLDPKSPTAMNDNKYPITKIGMHNLLDTVIEQWEAEGKFGETVVQYYPDAKLDDSTPCMVIETKHPQPRDQFKFHMTRLFLDDATKYPIRVEQYGFPGKRDTQPPLVEEYTYTKVKVNVGLKDRDFDHLNAAYQFPK